MTWSARIEHTPAGLALTFGAPLSRLDMAPDVAQHLASLLAVEARHRMRAIIVALDDHEHASNAPNSEQLSGVASITTAHPLCCDCELCLNGDHHA